jgi:uncharacterized 2Fe-2S/4Fe-4S cluster protein (DUF4445 family)
MYQVKIMQNEKERVLRGESGESLLDILQRNQVYLEAACGGTGRCGKCKVKFITGVPPITEADRKFIQAKQLANGWRLACFSFPKEDCTIQMDPQEESDFTIVANYHSVTSSGQSAKAQPQENATGYFIGVDIGTTTIAISLIEAGSKKMCQTVTRINRQRMYGADVMTRIQASVAGKQEELKECITMDLYEGIGEVMEGLSGIADQVTTIAIAGNTTMGHLLMGYPCKNLGVYPFSPVNIRTIRTTYGEVFHSCLENGIRSETMVVLLPGFSAFVGGDIMAGLLLCRFDQHKEPCMFIDLGTNGEMAIGNKDKIMVTSTAAGPAFEGGNISCGVGSVPGAICKVALDRETKRTEFTTIGNKAPLGLCGTGVIEMVSELLKAEWIDETGRFVEEYFQTGFNMGKNQAGEELVLTQKDIREIQLAKAAIRAGVETMQKRFGISYHDVAQVYLAGGFGYTMNLDKMFHIGMLPKELAGKIQTVGNSSLGGVHVFLTSEESERRMEQLLDIATQVELSMDDDFNDLYIENMYF